MIPRQVPSGVCAFLLRGDLCYRPHLVLQGPHLGFPGRAQILVLPVLHDLGFLTGGVQLWPSAL